MSPAVLDTLQHRGMWRTCRMDVEGGLPNQRSRGWSSSLKLKPSNKHINVQPGDMKQPWFVWAYVCLTEVGERGSCLTEWKNESRGQRRVSKAIEVYEGRIQEKKTSQEWEGSSQGCHWWPLELVFNRKLIRELKSLNLSIAPLSKDQW